MNAPREVIVVGAGSAGSVVTRRLLDAGVKVTLLEAGKPDENPAIHDLGRLGELWLSDDDWGYFTTPQKNAFQRQIHWPRGKVMGGSHSLNASIWVRGAHADFDRWVEEGAEGWGWSDVEPYFKKAERWLGEPQSEERGTEGPQEITDEFDRAPIFEGILEAAKQAGLPEMPDYNVGELDGVAWMQFTTRGKQRLSSWRSYVMPKQDDPNLTIETGVWVTRLLIEDGKVTGLEAEVDGETKTYSADEVILCAGALDSPRILLLSGIGPKDHLDEVGIEVKHELKGVGENLHDHLLVPMVYEATKGQLDERLENQPVCQVHSWTTFREGSDAPDTQPIYFSVPMVPPGTDVPANSFTLQAGMVRPLSRGTLRLASSDPHEKALMDPNIFDRQEDVDSLMASIKQMREIGSQAALLDGFGAKEVLPGPDADTDEALDKHMREFVTTYHHQVGTCKMGPDSDEMAVVCPKTLRVHGLEGLRVVDASVMPSVPSGNTNAPSIMIGERGAEMILSGE